MTSGDSRIQALPAHRWRTQPCGLSGWSCLRPCARGLLRAGQCLRWNHLPKHCLGNASFAGPIPGDYLFVRRLACSSRIRQPSSPFRIGVADALFIHFPGPLERLWLQVIPLLPSRTHLDREISLIRERSCLVTPRTLYLTIGKMASTGRVIRVGRVCLLKEAVPLVFLHVQLLHLANSLEPCPTRSASCLKRPGGGTTPSRSFWAGRTTCLDGAASFLLTTSVPGRFYRLENHSANWISRRSFGGLSPPPRTGTGARRCTIRTNLLSSKGTVVELRTDARLPRGGLGRPGLGPPPPPFPLRNGRVWLLP